MEYTVVYSQINPVNAKRKRFERASQKLDGILRINDIESVNPPHISPIPDKGMLVTLLQEIRQTSDPDDSNEPSDSDGDSLLSKKRAREQRHKSSARRLPTSKANALVYSGPITKICRTNVTGLLEEEPSQASSLVALHEDDVLILDRWEVQIVGMRHNHSSEGHIPILPKLRITGPLIAKDAPGGVVSQVRSLQRPIQSVVARKPLRLTNQRPIQKHTTSLHSTSLQSTKKPNPELSTAFASHATMTVPPFLVLPHIPLPGSIRTALKPHQVSGVDFLWRTLKEKHGCILGDEMGLGKTLMTIACITAIHRTHREKQYVVVCPSSLILNWANEFDKWLGRASQPKRIVIREGGSEALQQIRSFVQRTNQQVKHQPGQVLIVSYDLFRRNSNAFTMSEGVTMGLLVVDEGHRLKSATESLTFTALESLKTDGRLCITATPIQNNLSEFFNLAQFCCPGILGPDLAYFRKHYERPIVVGNQKEATRSQRDEGFVKSKELEIISKSFMIRRLQKDVLKSTLPPRTEVLLFCRPSKLQCQLYRSACHPKIVGNFAESLIALTLLRKICAHPLLHKKENEIGITPISNDVKHSGKLVVLAMLLQQIRLDAPDDKIVIVSNFTSVLSVIESSVLRPRSYSYLRLDGATQNRQGLIDTFNRTSANRNFCLLLSAKAGGCGLNIVGANRLFMFDPDWNPATCQQAMGRIYRQGQTKPCLIYRLFTTGTVEEVIYQRQLLKGGLVNQTVDAGTSKGKQNWSHDKAPNFTKEELADCFTLNDHSSCCTKEKFGNHWPDYHISRLSRQGCTDVSLLAIAPSVSNELSFVHVVASGVQEQATDSDEESVVEQRLESTMGYQSDSDEHEFAM